MFCETFPTKRMEDRSKKCVETQRRHKQNFTAVFLPQLVQVVAGRGYTEILMARGREAGNDDLHYLVVCRLMRH